MVTVYYTLLVVITFERLAELVVSQRHATHWTQERQRCRGQSAGAQHYVGT